jgi:hypothetical protein
MGSDSDSDHVEVKELPRYRLIHSDMPEKMLREILFGKNIIIMM